MQKRGITDVLAADEAESVDCTAIKERIARLTEQKRLLEESDELVTFRLLSDFLVKFRDRKQKELEGLQGTLAFLDRDLGKVKEALCKTLASPDTQSLASEDGLFVPSLGALEASPQQHSAKRRYLVVENVALDKAIEHRRERVDVYFEELVSAYETSSQKQCAEDHLGSFRSTLGKIAAVSQLKEVASIRLQDSAVSSNIISSAEFSHEGHLLATGGVSKKIKIFTVDNLLSGPPEYLPPAISIANEGKISSLCWNPYITGQLGAADYDGIVSLYDATTGQPTHQFDEHERRIWSLDFSHNDPTRFASGSDDGRVKVWSLHTKRAVCTVDAKANICSVNFSPANNYTIAFGSADHSVHVYDLRNPARRLFHLQGHQKAVSYVKWAANDELASASTDSTIRLWRLGTDGTDSVETVKKFSGHANVRNFVGLALNSDLLACGSETNTVHVYHRALSCPWVSYHFQLTCPITGRTIVPESNQFISSVNWRPNTNQLVAANSEGQVKILELGGGAETG